MITADFKLTAEFNEGLSGLIAATRLNAKVVVAKETGELIKTLVRLSPPQDPDRTRELISQKINKKFYTMGKDNDFSNLENKPGSTGVKWYAASSKFLFGGAADSDKRKSSKEELLQLYYRIKSVQYSNRIVLDFKHPRRRQKVAIISKIITTQNQVAALVKRVQGHVGRLKAAWLVAVLDGKIKLTGAFLPPRWVSKHANRNYGVAIDGLNTPDRPSFTLVNSAKGVTSRTAQYLINSAVATRAAAMRDNALRFMRGQKKISDYGKGKTFVLN
jgi:hypothetical protein